MPELPEVETTRQGIASSLIGQTIDRIVVRTPRLRFPVPTALQKISGCKITAVERRAKYLLIETTQGSILTHLGMSGSMRMIDQVSPAGKHDHIDLMLSNGHLLRYNDPRKFGCWLWIEKKPYNHPLLANLGPEPLSKEFNSKFLFAKTRHKKVVIKKLLMNQNIVVGIGNIYANEALFLAGIHPSRIAASLSQQECDLLVKTSKKILTQAIKIGGTTIRNFSNAAGKPGYFVQKLLVYGRTGQSCKNCQTILQEIRIDQRSTVFCVECQK